MEKRMAALRYRLEKDLGSDLAGINEAFREVKYWKEAIQRGVFDVEIAGIPVQVEHSLKEKFKQQAIDLKGEFNVLVTAVKLPTGAIETIINNKELKTKIEYLVNAYDDDFCLKNNPQVQIVGFMLV
jgi:hypothetical protein